MGSADNGLPAGAEEAVGQVGRDAGRHPWVEASRGVRIASAAVFFIVTLFLLTGLGLALTDRQGKDWFVVMKADGSGDDVYAKLAFRFLAEWDGTRKEPPPSVAELDGERVEVHGLARSVKGQSGFWLVTDPLEVGESREPAIRRSVWVEFPDGELPSWPLAKGSLVRARGVLRVGLAEAPDAGAVAYRLELTELWMRHSVGDGCPGGHEDDSEHEHAPSP